ncbi:unnamed protein product [Dicrocoelium dendriticum]|nr:unnamed protein product [Dicrocoelium dendriticum]
MPLVPFIAVRLAFPLRCISFLRKIKSQHGPSYYILPELPPSNQNASSAFGLNELPSPTSVTPGGAFNDFSRLLVEYQLSLSRLSESLKKGDFPSSFSILHALEEIFYPVEHAFQILQSIPSYNADPVWLVILGRLFRKWKNCRADCFCLDPQIYRALLTSLSSQDLTRSEKGLLLTLINDCWEHGADISLEASGTHNPQNSPTSNNLQSTTQISQAQEKLDRLRDVRSSLEEEERLFQSMVVACSSVIGAPQAPYSGRLPDPSEIDFLIGSPYFPVAESDLAPSAPDWLPDALGGRQNGGHVADMRLNIASDFAVQTLLQHCSTRQVRETVWLNRVKRCSLRYFGGASGHHASNDARMQDIRRLRHELARFMGCVDWLHLLWRNKHVRSPESPESLIYDILEPLRTSLKPAAQTELQLLSEWSTSNLGLRSGKLEPWDIDYAVEQYNFAGTYPQLNARIRPPTGSLDTYVYSLLNQLANLFQLQLVPQPDKHNGSSVYRVEDISDGRFFGELILDLFAKPGRSPLFGQSIPIVLATQTRLHESGVCIRPRIGKHSVVALLSRLPENSKVDGIGLQDILSISSGFGGCLQHLIPDGHYHSLTGLSPCISPDIRYLAGDLCSALMFNSILRPVIEQKFESNNSESKFKTYPFGMRPPPSRIVALPILRQLYEARFDLSLWSHDERKRHWVQINESMWDLHLPYGRHRDDSWPTSATNLFGPNSQAGLLYHHIWRHITLYDTLASLQEQGWPANNQSIAVLEVLKRFRDTFLAAPDRLPPLELFRRFRGRPPSHEFMLDALRLQSKPVESPILMDPVVPLLAHE